jgi:bifunctional UDP-N-acetylglucosamine pyrophosphorylase/glucosamine-1-phosphate N-acetyltransferase
VTTSQLAAVITAGGLGTRMKSGTPKHLHPLLGRRLVDWVLAAVRPLEPDRLVVVTSPERRDDFANDDVAVAIQEEPRGTGDAVAASAPALQGFDGTVLVLEAAAPLLTSELLADLVEAHRREGAAATVLSFEPLSPLPYGRVVRDRKGAVQAVVEEADATPEQHALTEVVGAMWVFESGDLWTALGALDSENAQGELYLTDTVRHLVARGRKVGAYRSPDPIAPIGINTRAELAAAAAILRDRINNAHMLAGATIFDPGSTWIDADVELEPDTILHPFTVLRGRTRIAAGAEVGPHVVVDGAEIGREAVVGPFCYLRPGTVLQARAKAGAFVEIKNSTIGEGAKVPHQSYIGDAEIGEGTNIAAGNITANFSHRPGVPKGRTRIGRNVRTGVDNTFKAPVTIGDEAWIYPGTVITEDVPPGALAGFPPRQVNKENYVRGDGND